MGVMNLLRSKFENLSIEIKATDGEITDRDYEVVDPRRRFGSWGLSWRRNKAESLRTPPFSILYTLKYNTLKYTNKKNLLDIQWCFVYFKVYYFEVY